MAKYLNNDGVLYLWGKIKGLFNQSIKNLSVSGRTITFTRGDGTTGTITTQDTTYSNMTGATSSESGKAGLVPAPSAGKQTSFLRGDGTWVVPTNTTYGVVSKTANGLTPMLPNESTTTKYLRQDGTWAVPPNTTYNVASQSANGLMSSTDKKKLDGIASGAEVNQNAFSKVMVGSSTIEADSKTDTLNIVFGEYMSVEATPSEDKLTFNVVVDSSLSVTSTKPISNKAVYNALLGKVDIEDIEDMQSQINSAQQTANQAYNAVGDLENHVDEFITETDRQILNLGTGIADINALLPNYALKSDITNMYKYKGSVTNSSNLPTSGQAVGDTYNIVNASTYGPAGTNVSWTGSAWDALGGLFEIESITNSELDSICV